MFVSFRKEVKSELVTKSECPHEGGRSSTDHNFFAHIMVNFDLNRLINLILEFPFWRQLHSGLAMTSVEQIT